MSSKAASTIMVALSIAFYSRLGLTAANSHQLNLPTFAALDCSKIAIGPKAEHINIVMNGEAGTAMAVAMAMAAFKHL